jgi:nucleotide-binding universal stress UspA family protein
MVLMDDNFASIVNGIEEGRSVFDNLKKFIVYVYAHNWAELLAFIAFVLLGTPLPLAVVQVLAIDLMMEIPPSLSLTLEPPEPGIMERPPRSRRSRLFDLGALARSAYIGVIIGLVALMLCFLAWSRGGWAPGSSTIKDPSVYIKGTTVMMAAIMAGQLGTLLATRTNVRSAFTVSPLRNKWLLAAIMVEVLVLLAVVYVPPLQMLFSTGPLAPVDWIYIYSFFPAIILLEEGRKYLLRRFVLPAPLAPPVPLPALEAPARPLPGHLHSRPFQEIAPPILLAVFLGPGEQDAVRFSLRLGRQSGSRVVIMPPSPGARLDRSIKDVQRRVDELAAEGVPVEEIEVHLPGRVPGRDFMVDTLRKAIDGTGADTIVVPVDRKALSRGRPADAIGWASEFQDKRLLLVSGPKKGSRAPSRLLYRILIPVLGEFHNGPFELAERLTAGSVIPDVDVVAARVLEMPRTGSLYSIYRRESLAIDDSQLSFVRTRIRRPLRKLIHPTVLLVRNIGSDIARFAREREVDLIIMEGRRDAGRQGLLSREEAAIAARAGCTVVVVIAPLPRAS